MTSVTDSFNFAHFDAKAFEQKYWNKEKQALPILRKAFPLGTPVTDDLIALYQHFDRMDYGFAFHLKGLIVLEAVADYLKKRGEEQWLKIIQDKPVDQLRQMSFTIDTKLPDKEKYVVRYTAVGFCLKNASKMEAYAAEHRDDEFLLGITYGMMLDYRQSLRVQNVTDTHDHTLKVIKAVIQNRKPLRRK